MENTNIQYLIAIIAIVIIFSRCIKIKNENQDIKKKIKEDFYVWPPTANFIPYQSYYYNNVPSYLYKDYWNKRFYNPYYYPFWQYLSPFSSWPYYPFGITTYTTKKKVTL